MRKKKLPLLLSLIAIPMLASCTILDGGGNNSNNNNNNNNNGNNGGGGSGTPAETFRILDPDTTFVQRNSVDEVTYEDLFNLNNKVEIVLDVTREEMQKINDDNVYTGKFDAIKPETYHLANKFTLTLHNGSKTFKWELENVGIKQKGNTSREPIFNNGEIRNQNHFKISFNETFTETDRYDSSFIAAHGNPEYKDRELLGLDALDIKWNKIDDTTHIKEIYSNMLLRSAGVLAQHTGLAMMEMHYDGSKVSNFGLCSIFEPANKSFVKRSLQSDTYYVGMPSWKEEKNGTHGVEGKKYGDLYKASYGKGDGAHNDGGANFTSSSISGKRLGVKTDIRGYNWPTYERKTNTGETYNDQQMKDLVSLLNNSNATFAQISEKVDTQYLAMEEAVMYFLGSPDAMRYNYNNYMVYFRRTDGKMVIIPIDNDRCFGVGNDWKSGADFILSSNAKPNSSQAANGSQRNPLLNKTLFASGSNQLKTDYDKCITLVKNSKWLKNETFLSFYNIAKETYKGLASFSLDGGHENISFSSYVDQKLALAGGSSNNNQGGNNDGGNGGSQTSGDLIKSGNYYIVGSFNSWGNKGNAANYKLQEGQDDSGKYLVCNFMIIELEDDTFKLKIGIGEFKNWSESYGFDRTDNNDVNYLKKGDSLPSIKDQRIRVGSFVRLFVWMSDGHYAFYPLEEMQLLYSVEYFTKNQLFLNVNRDTNLPLSKVTDGQYSASVAKDKFDNNNAVALRLQFDIDGVSPYFFTVVSNGNGGLKIAFDMVAPSMEPEKIIVEGNFQYINVTIDLYQASVTYQKY